MRACSHRGQCSHSAPPVSAGAPLCWEWSTAPLGPSVRPGKHASRQRREERRGEERRGEERRGEERKGKERKGKERKGKERKGKEKRREEKRREEKRREEKRRNRKQEEGRGARREEERLYYIARASVIAINDII